MAIDKLPLHSIKNIFWPNIYHSTLNISMIESVCNQNFIQIAEQIYPNNIPLESNNSDDNRDVFLDLDIQICDE